MPYIETITTKKINKETETSLKERMGKAIECIKGKTERWLMLSFRDAERMAFSGDSKSDCAMLSVSLFGKASESEYNSLTATLTALVSEELEIEASRIYIKYSEINTWGFNGENF